VPLILVSPRLCKPKTVPKMQSGIVLA
jgi:hypothetical protein